MVTSYTFQERQAPNAEDSTTCGCCTPDTLDIDIHKGLCCPPPLLLIRALALAVMGIRFGFNLVDNYYSLFRIFQFLTYLGFIVSFLYFLIVIEDYLLNECGKTKTSPNLKHNVNLLFEIAFCLEVPITALYWLVIYTPGDNPTTLDLIKDIGNHGFPLASLLLDFIFNSYRFPVRHLLPVVGTAIFYLFINLGNFEVMSVYTLKVEKIYSAIDWTSTESYVYVVVAIALVGFLHCAGQICWYCCKRGRIESTCQIQQIAQLSAY